MKQNGKKGIKFIPPSNGFDKEEYQVLARDMRAHPDVGFIWLFDEEPSEKSIERHKIGELFLVGEEPGIHKTYYQKMMNASDEDGHSIKLVNLSQMHTPHTIDNLKDFLLRMIAQQTSNRIKSIQEVRDETLVIGGGIAGIQAALEIANSGTKVYLVEKQATIGGHMAMFDKTFPTLDCAACILTPKMVEVGQHDNIELLTYTELDTVEGGFGNFKVRLNRKAKFVDETTCIGCGSCAEKCPAKASSEFDVGTSLRKAIYMPFQQAVPNKYVIDKESCRYILSDGEKCGVCVKFCPVENCIQFDQVDKEYTINVGNIIVATGFKPFQAQKMERYGYGLYDNVITSIELERLINAGGPTDGKIVYPIRDKKGNRIFKKDSDSPQKIGLIHCIGSRDHNHHEYCSKVCCMYSLKLAHLVKEKIPDAEVFEFFIDMRAYGKGYEEFYQRIKSEGIHMIRGKTAKVEQKGNALVIRSEDILNQRLLNYELDMVVLSVALEPQDDVQSLQMMLGIEKDVNAWFTSSCEARCSITSSVPGIYVAGACEGPKDIPDSVVQASAAAAKVLQSIQASRTITKINKVKKLQEVGG